MRNVFVTTGENQLITVPFEPSLTLMEAIRDCGIDELLASCGGCCSFATCHVHVDRAFFDVLAPMSSDEDDLLDSSPARTDTSRLSCQIILSESLDAMAVQIAPED